MTEEDKFMGKVEKLTNGCWFWKGGYTDTGYGRFCTGGAVWRAHVWSYHHLKKIPLPEGKLVRHKCQKKWCVNPEHLIPGTKSDNMYDYLLQVKPQLYEKPIEPVGTG